MFVDTHCHIIHERYKDDAEQIIQRAAAANVAKLITVGCDIKDSEKAQKAAHEYENVFFTAGIHPHEAEKVEPNYIAKLENISKDGKCVAIGECGLDYYYEHSPKEAQRRVFREQIRLAHKTSKPIVVHMRDAWDESLEIYKEEGIAKVSTVIHCFSGSLAYAKACLDIGCYLSLSGIVTFKKAGELLEVAKYCPLDRLLIETDAPFLAPVPYRGKQNEPAYVVEVARKIAELKDISIDEIANATTRNANSVFGV